MFPYVFDEPETERASLQSRLPDRPHPPMSLGSAPVTTGGRDDLCPTGLVGVAIRRTFGPIGTVVMQLN